MFARSSSFELDGTDTGDLAEGKIGKLGASDPQSVGALGREVIDDDPRAALICGRNRLIMPCVSKATAVRRSVLSARPVSCARSSFGGIPYRTTGLNLDQETDPLTT